jgi:competence protein ComEA
MQHIPAWARSKAVLFAAGAVVLGATILAWSFLGSGGAAAPTNTAPAIQDGNNSGSGITTLDAERAPTQPPKPDAKPAAEFAIVYISGAVLNPDVYQVPVAARIKDVVLAAGGLSEDAAADKINLAARVTDAQHIHIPRQGEEPPVAATVAADTPTDGKDTLININTAGAAELESLPGIGQSLAQRIVEYRTSNGPFQSAEDLRKVKGIGAALFTKIAPLVTIEQ